ILSMIDGKQYKTLKRHLSTNGLTPAEYRDRYKLPRDYPMVAPGYSEQRREVAKRLGLGRKPEAPAVAVSESEETPAPVETVEKAPT
ncbi:MucR family transcriptional regulator, partial [Klebsiella pneumoniae]|uniref:MucR family transcriptional regulator n=1 Tax=Klebsiella pneumoniae TaxID=573 RepID=UPI0023B0FDE4